MSKLDKLKKKFFEKPCRNDMTWEEIEKLVRAYGCVIKGGGKHPYRIAYVPTGTVIPIPIHGKTIGEAYIGQLQMLFREIEQLEGEK